MDALTYATLQVVIDGQAYLHAILVAGADAPDEEFQAAMDAYKEDHAGLVEEVLMRLVAKAEAAEEEE